MMLDIPTSIPLSEVNLPLPSSEEEWSAASAEEWKVLHNASTAPPTPTFKEAFESLFAGSIEHIHRYSEFGGYIMISGIQSALLNAHRLVMNPAISFDWKRFDVSLDTWQHSWDSDPKSRSTGPSSPFGIMALNASAIYRATRVIRHIKDYSRFP
jgi:hypothetical protein